ncbi:hypothetical protein SAMN04488577_3092 [Bacillus sp. cl95]|nr:hypothetical protein SAMN02799634_10526 [Bacillus sp. UNCCL13]SFQ87645.1 hypothetical protein SAMN04488577_3092 [Bacillus sp. cl95]
MIGLLGNMSSDLNILMNEQKAQAPCLAPTGIRRITQYILEKAIAFSSCDVDAAEVLLVLISGVIWLMTEVVLAFKNNPEGLGAGSGLLENRRKLSTLFYLIIT